MRPVDEEEQEESEMKAESKPKEKKVGHTSLNRVSSLPPANFRPAFLRISTYCLHISTLLLDLLIFE